MKKKVLPLLFVFCFCIPVLSAYARPVEQLQTLIDAPMDISNGPLPRMHVVFQHAKHAEVSCLTCHHKMTAEQDIFVACNTAPGCHTHTEAADRSNKSYFLAIHRLDSDHSCRGCHMAKSAERPRLAGCQTCHSALPLPNEYETAR